MYKILQLYKLGYSSDVLMYWRLILNGWQIITIILHIVLLYYYIYAYIKPMILRAINIPFIFYEPIV